MLLEGIGQAFEQPMAVVAMVGQVGGQGRQSLAFPQLIQPMTPPGSVVEKSMQVRAGDATPSWRGAPPAETRLMAERLQSSASWVLPWCSSKPETGVVSGQSACTSRCRSALFRRTGS